MRIFPILLLLCLSCSTSGLNIIVYNTCVAKSHASSLSILINALTDGGHTVDLVMARMNTVVKNAGNHNARNLIIVDFPNMDSPWNRIVGHLNDPFLEYSSWNPFKSLVNTFMDVNEELCPLVLDSPEVDRLLKSNKYDIGLTIGYDLCGVGLLHGYGIKPVASYTTAVLFYFQVLYGGYPELPLYENMILDAPSRVDRSRFGDRVITLARALHARWTHEGQADRANDLFRSRYGADFPDIRQLSKELTFDFVNSNPLMDEPRPISSRIKFIGGMGLAKPKPLDASLNRVLASAKKGTVVFSFGTQVPAQNISPRIFNIFSDAFSAFPDFNFIWKFDGKTKMNSSNIHNVEWLPQTDLLHDKRVVGFISHMGMNSFVESAHAGVPLICIPLFADQFHNTRQAVRLGTGIMLEKTMLSTDIVVDALRKLLLDSKYITTARELASKLENNPDKPERVLLEGVQFLSKHKDLHKHFLLEGANHNFFVAHGYDVIVFLFSLCLFIVVVLLKLVGGVLRVISRSAIKSKTE